MAWTSGLLNEQLFSVNDHCMLQHLTEECIGHSMSQQTSDVEAASRSFIR
jgi:hypothetical protein